MSGLDWDAANRRDKRAREELGQNKPLGRNVYPPSAKQLALLRKLAGEVGQTFATPRTSQQASARITELLALKRRRKKPRS